MSKNIINSLNDFFIAEIGTNHNQKKSLVKKMIREVAKTECQCVKYQIYEPDEIVNKKVMASEYGLNKYYGNISAYKMFDQYLKTPKQWFPELIHYATKFNLKTAVTIHGDNGLRWAIKNKPHYIKIASMDLNNYQFLDYIARKNKPIILSIGMGSLQELDKAIETIEIAGNNKIIILHCLAIYPAPDKNINLSRIDTLKNIYPYPVGYSDHSLGTSVSIGAVAKGAVVIEKHFTMDKNMVGWDHKISSDYTEMKSLITDCKRVNLALGNNRIIRTEDNERVKEFRRSIVAAKNIKKGEKFSKDMFDFKRPGSGLEPNMANFIIGRKSKRNISYDEIIRPDDF